MWVKMLQLAIQGLYVLHRIVSPASAVLCKAFIHLLKDLSSFVSFFMLWFS